MKAQISFNQPKDVSPNDLHGVIIRFPFTVRKIQDGANKDIISDHTIDAEITSSLQATWRLESNIPPLQNNALVKTLFEHARREIENKMKSGSLDQHSKIDLHVGNSQQSNPFDPEKIPEPTGFSYEVELKNHIGFKL
jgi:hypothetical protein